MDRNPYVWNQAVAVAGVYLNQANVQFPNSSRSSQSRFALVTRNSDKTGLGLSLLPPLVIDWWSWEYACWPQLVELRGAVLPTSLTQDGVKMAEYVYDLLYVRLVALGRVPPL